MRGTLIPTNLDFGHMLAYGTLQPLAQSHALQSSVTYELQRKKRAEAVSAPEQKADCDWTHVTIFHLTAHNAPPELIDVMFKEFSDELERDDARTYPQEKGMTKEDFVGYYFARDVFVGLGISINEETTPAQSTCTLEDARAGREWQSAVAGFYCIKPNYPGHSSHLCNAGFVIPYSRRGLGLGYIMGTSMLHFAPALGYRGSVFNLVYADNPASLRIWDTLGFQRVGLIPGAGKRTRTIGAAASGEDPSDAQREEVYYVDAHVIFKSFV